MPARAPLDVDLEDKLLYGLTPMRLGYAVLALLGAFGSWSSIWAAAPVRGAACAAILIAGATLAWGRWHGRAVDCWLADIAAFVARTKRIVWNDSLVDRVRRRSRRGDTAPITPGANDCEGEASDEGVPAAIPDVAIATG
jgi:hypothetical protein